MSYTSAAITVWSYIDRLNKRKGVRRSKNTSWTDTLRGYLVPVVAKKGFGWWMRWIMGRVKPTILNEVADAGLRVLTGGKQKKKVPLLVGILVCLFVPAPIVRLGSIGWWVIKAIANVGKKKKKKKT